MPLPIIPSTPDVPWWPINAPVDGPSLLYVGSDHFALRGWLPVLTAPYVENDRWFIRLSVGQDSSIVARLSNTRMVLINSGTPEAQVSTCSLCRRPADARGCCGLELGSLYDPLLPNRVMVYGVPNLARLSGRQAAQEFFPYEAPHATPIRRYVSV
jgi:hypothetical protein